MLEDADHLIDGAVETHGFSYAIRIWEERLADRCAEHYDWPSMLLVEVADEAAAIDAEQGNRLGVLWLRTAHDYFLDAVIPAGDRIAVAEEKSSRSDGGDDLHIGSRLLDESSVAVFDVLARANPLRPA